MTKFLTLSNNQAKFIKSLSNSNIRKETNSFLVEGQKCCSELLNSNYLVSFIVINSDDTTNKNNPIITEAQKRNIKIFQIKNSIFEKLCDTKTPQSVIAIAQIQSNSIFDNQSFIALDNVSDPGNVGTIIRTADWFGIKQIIFFDNSVDKYSPKVIRSSMGSIFRINIIEEKDNYNILKKHFPAIPIFAASLNGKIDLKSIHPTKKFGLIVGNEARGISAKLNKFITQSIFIGGQGTAESLNVAVATGIALFHFFDIIKR